MDLLSEEEQWERLRGWFAKNGLFLAGTVLLSLAAVGGWRWWQGQGETQAVAANTAYETRIFGPDRVRVQGRLIGLMRKY